MYCIVIVFFCLYTICKLVGRLPRVFRYRLYFQFFSQINKQEQGLSNLTLSVNDLLYSLLVLNKSSSVIVERTINHPSRDVSGSSTEGKLHCVSVSINLWFCEERKAAFINFAKYILLFRLVCSCPTSCRKVQ